MSGPAQNDIATASDRKDAVRKAFNQEYLATQQAMSQAAERARAQVLDQKQTIANHAENVKSGAQPPQPPIGHATPTHTPPTMPPQGAPQMASDPNAQAGQKVMFDIANEIRNIIAQEIDLRMQAISAKVEAALSEAFPPSDQGRNSTNDPKSDNRSAPSKKSMGAKKP